MANKSISVTRETRLSFQWGHDEIERMLREAALREAAAHLSVEQMAKARVDVTLEGREWGDVHCVVSVTSVESESAGSADAA
jgi:hypothetical protein